MKERPKRKYTRVPYSGKVDLSFEYKEYMGCEVENLCLSGMLVRSCHDQEVGQRCEVTIHGAGMTNNRLLQLCGEIVRKDQYGVAILFTEMNLRSYTNLQTLILDHADDPFKIAEEFVDELPANQQ